MRSVPVAVVLCALLVSGCATASGGPSPSAGGLLATSARASASASLSSETVGIAVIGHSGATGYDSDPDRPGEDVRANSWATGTNPQVHSIYLRLLAGDPSLKGHTLNLAIDGTDVVSLIAQASQLAGRLPGAELVLVQSIDNDIRCDGTDAANYQQYRTKLTQVLDILTHDLPKATIFFVSQWATVATYDRVVFSLKPGHLTGDGPCDTVDFATGQIDAAKEVFLQGLVTDYWDIVTETCALYVVCRTDGGAMQQMDLVAGDLASDLSHLSVAGHAKMAAMVWEALNGSP